MADIEVADIVVMDVDEASSGVNTLRIDQEVEETFKSNVTHPL